MIISRQVLLLSYFARVSVRVRRMVVGPYG